MPGAGRLAGDDLPPPPAAGAQAAQAAADARAGAVRAPSASGCSRCCTRERFVDVSPEETWATLLDEGTYLCSTRTMYRILAAHHGGVRERRDQLTHPPTRSPSCSPSGRTSCGRGTCSKLKGPAKWTYYYLYVILDVFSRYIVGWTVQYRENGQLAKALIEQADRAAADHPQDPDAARRSRRAAARQAGRVPARRPRHHQDA